MTDPLSPIGFNDSSPNVVRKLVSFVGSDGTEKSFVCHAGHAHVGGEKCDHPQPMLRVSPILSTRISAPTIVKVHTCPNFRDLNPEPKDAQDFANLYGYGPALDDDVYRLGGVLTMGNGEYVIRVAFCPYCGIDLRKLP